MTLEAVLAEVVAEQGTSEGLARYHELRERYYGRGAYDFGEGGLVRLARQLGEKGHRDQALPFLELNVELFPESFRAHFALGEGRLAAGHRALACASYRRALELRPGDPFIQKRLSEAEAAEPSP
jgi:tetratricopeptide (TPR) repeat protein